MKRSVLRRISMDELKSKSLQLCLQFRACSNFRIDGFYGAWRPIECDGLAEALKIFKEETYFKRSNIRPKEIELIEAVFKLVPAKPFLFENSPHFFQPHRRSFPNYKTVPGLDSPTSSLSS